MSIATITTKGQVTLPKDVRERLHLETGEKIDFQVDETTGTAVMVPLNKKIDDVCGMLGTRIKTVKGFSPAQMDKGIAARMRSRHG